MNSSPMQITQEKHVRFSEMLDAQRRYLTNSPTPAGMAAALQAVDVGDIGAMCEIATEIEGKDAHLQALSMLRRQAVTELEWSIEPSDPNDRLAVDVAEFVSDTLLALPTFQETLEHLQTAIGPGVAVTELVWHRGMLVETNDVPGHRLTGTVENPNDLGIMTDEEQVNGIPAKPGKFAVHYTNCRAGFPLHVTLTRASIWPWIIKHHSLADWVSFSEIFGIPFKHWKYSEGATEEEKRQLRDTAKNVGPDAWGVTSDDIELSVVESAKGTHPGETLIDWADRKLSILWLGQTLTTDVGSSGSFAMAKIHENVKASITFHDIKTEQRTIEKQIIEPMIRLRWPGRSVPMPRFKRRIFESRNLEAERLAIDKLRLARELGLRIDSADAYDLLNLPMPKDGDPQT